jgi:hypothetical protein
MYSSASVEQPSVFYREGLPGQGSMSPVAAWDSSTMLAIYNSSIMDLPPVLSVRTNSRTPTTTILQ